ncbi:MAG: YjbH domain-containing protein [Pseudomonadales bacterium]|jgi:hypothetical protein
MNNAVRIPRLALAITLIGLSTVAIADEFDAPQLSYTNPSYSDFGGVGLLQTPTARMAGEGMFSLGARTNDDYIFYSTNVQLFPWLETSIRYTIVKDILYSSDPGFSGDTELTDKGIDIKLRLLEEGDYLPNLAVGVRDIGGTGLFAGEYLVANKRYQNFDLSLGMGFGYLGQSANLAGDRSLDAACGRSGSYGGNGGQVDYDRWFTGCVGVFGGMSYQTPYSPLTLKLEYDGNDFSNESPGRRGKEIEYNTPWNIGAVYALDDWGQFTLSYQRGTTFSVGFNLLADFGSTSRRWNDTASPILNANAQQVSQEQQDAHYRALMRDLQNEAGYVVNRISSEDDALVISAQQIKYRDRYQANERAVTLMANAEPTVNEYKIITLSHGVEVVETSVQREDLLAYANQAAPNMEYKSLEQRAVPTEPAASTDYYQRNSGWGFSVEPTLGQSFGSSEDFYLFNIGISGSASYWLTDNLQFSSSAYLNLYDNYDKFLYTLPSDGTSIPRVRTLIRQYLENNTVLIDSLKLAWYDRLGDNHFIGLHGGYLEQMYAGGVVEYLYREVDASWAVGFEAAYVAQRDPETQLGLFDERVQCQGATCYEVITGDFTGHVNLHYRIPQEWLNGVSTKLSFGKYLAGDVGATVNFTKAFDSGVVIGAFATKTDLSAAEYGEGSFTKGFFISMPFDLFTTQHTNSRANIGWAPLTRDGGQKLGFGSKLHGVSAGRSPVQWENPNRP